jgi:hypothetical protein
MAQTVLIAASPEGWFFFVLFFFFLLWTRRFETMPWCQACRDFDVHQFGQKGFPTRGYRYNAVRDAASAGCEFCSLLLAAFSSSITIRFAKQEAKLTSNFWFHFRIEKTVAHQGDGLGACALVASLALSTSDETTAWDNIPLRNFHLAADPGE